MTYGLWRVVGRRAYRGHEPGVEFEAVIPSGAAARAIARGDLVLIEALVAGLPDEHCLPEGWVR